MAATREPISVSAALADAKAALAGLSTFVVAGEVTGFRGPNARSGHCYFQVKDDEATMDVIVWRGTYAKCGFELRDGLTIIMTGGFDVYAGSGRMSFIARKIEASGEGLLRQQVAALARKLQAEGLMDERRKRPIPRFCTRVAVVTSLSGSVIDDVRRTLARRNPLVELVAVGCAVQGVGAPATICRALDVAATAGVDAILLVRGGGSFEDLMTFNDEMLARHVAACPVPVITGIGHEPDTSICDMVSDRRSSTPTAAAESVAPALDEIVQQIEGRRQRLITSFGTLMDIEQTRVDGLGERVSRAMAADLSLRRQTVDAWAARRCLTSPEALVEDRKTSLALSAERLHDAMPRLIARRRERLAAGARQLDSAGQHLLDQPRAGIGRAAASLEALSPLKVLSRGYAIVRDGQGHVVLDAAGLQVGDTIEARLGAGSVVADVREVRAGD